MKDKKNEREDEMTKAKMTRAAEMEMNQPVDEAATDEATRALMAKVEELTGDLQRTRADFENYRKQVEVQKANERNHAKLATVYKILPLLDDMGRALETYTELAPLKKNFLKTMKDLGLEKIASEPLIEFEPTLHEAVMVEPGDGEKEVVAETLRPGYYYEGEVLRPAMVKVKRVSESKE